MKEDSSVGRAGGGRWSQTSKSSETYDDDLRGKTLINSNRQIPVFECRQMICFRSFFNKTAPNHIFVNLSSYPLDHSTEVELCSYFFFEKDPYDNQETIQYVLLSLLTWTALGHKRQHSV